MPDRPDNTLKSAISSIRAGNPVIVVDDATDPGSVFLVAPASSISEQQVCAMVNHGGGVICAALPEERIRELELPPMSASKRMAETGLEFTVSVEAREGVSTGISAADRARTLRQLAVTTNPKQDLVMPGHIFPTRARHGGVLVRSTISEASVDLLTLASVTPAAAFCHCLDHTGAQLKVDSARELARQTGFSTIYLSDLINARLAAETHVEHGALITLPTKRNGTFRALSVRTSLDNGEHLVLLKGFSDQNFASEKDQPLLVRVQAENRIGDLLGTTSFPSRRSLNGALNAINQEGRGIFVYIRHRGQDYLRKQLELQQVSTSTPDGRLAEMRQTGIGAQILRSLGVKKMKLLTNSTRNLSSISSFGLEIVETVPFESPYPIKQSVL